MQTPRSRWTWNAASGQQGPRTPPRAVFHGRSSVGRARDDGSALPDIRFSRMPALAGSRGAFAQVRFTGMLPFRFSISTFIGGFRNARLRCASGSRPGLGAPLRPIGRMRKISRDAEGSAVGIVACVAVCVVAVRGKLICEFSFGVCPVASLTGNAPSERSAGVQKSPTFQRPPRLFGGAGASKRTHVPRNGMRRSMAGRPSSCAGCDVAGPIRRRGSRSPWSRWRGAGRRGCRPRRLRSKSA